MEDDAVPSVALAPTLRPKSSSIRASPQLTAFVADFEEAENLEAPGMVPQDRAKLEVPGSGGALSAFSTAATIPMDAGAVVCDSARKTEERQINADGQVSDEAYNRSVTACADLQVPLQLLNFKAIPAARTKSVFEAS